ncbi:MAG: InlB B-repeat-containing protein [Oscillospiraceae bacterium]|nr:InlB B-repeat-containing protein [Oscillospiraceae bacterium]
MGVCPDLMVADTATLTIEDDPAKPDVGSLSFGQFDTNIVYGDPVYWDGGHYYCAAIGGAPSLDPKPHGDIFIRSGVINAQAQEGGAAIGGSMKDAQVAYKYLQYTGDPNNLVPYDEQNYLYRVPGDAQFDPDQGGYPVNDEGYAITIDAQGVHWYVPTNVRDTENDVLGFSRDGGKVIITGGVVNVIAAAGGAAIGGAVGGNGGEIYIRGGTVNASARMGAAALGAGERVKIDGEPRGGAGGIIEISGGCVVNCQSENNAYTLRGEPKNSYISGDEFLDDYMGTYYGNQGNVIGFSARSQMREGDYVKIYSGKGVDPVVILQQHVSNAYSPELDASWNNFLWPEDNFKHNVGTFDAQHYCRPTQISGGMIILIGRECKKDANGIPVDSQGRPLRDAENRPLAYDENGDSYEPNEYQYGEEVREISTHVISGWSDYGKEVPLLHNNYRVRGQISLPAWEDPWYSAERFTEFTLPKDTTITLLDGAVMNVSTGFKVHGTEAQLVVEDGAVIQGGGIWPGKPLNAPSTAPTEQEVKDLLDYLREKGQEENTGAESSARTIVTHLGVAKAGNGSRYIIPGDSADEIRASAAKDGAELLTIMNAGYCGFEQVQPGAWNLLISNQNTVVSLIENGALSIVPASKKNNEGLSVSVVEANGTVTVTGSYAKLSSPDYVVYEGKNDKTVVISFSPDDEYSKDLAFKVDMNSENNKAVFSVPNFMGSKFNLESVAPLKDKCALRYGGELNFTTPIANFAEVNIKQLQLNYGGKVTMLDGIEGGGSVQVPEFGGFPVSGGAEIYLNTFGGSQELSMSIELETPIFEGAFEASFKEVRGSGVIVPDTLKAELAVGEGGIPLVPPTVIGYLQGGGLGFEGLADTINMNSFGAPPIRLYISANASLLDVLDGKAEVSIGPSGFDLNLADIEIKGLDLIEEYGVSASWDAGKRTIKSREYWGMKTDMNQHLKIGVGYNGKKVLIANGQIGLGGFSGYAKDANGGLYYVVIQLEGYGNLDGSLQIPAGTVGPFPARDHTVANAQIGFYTQVGATTTIDAGKIQGKSAAQILRELVKSTKPHFDAAVGAKASIPGGWFIPDCHVMITYVFGDTEPEFSAGKGEGDPLDLRELVNAGAEQARTFTTLAMVEDSETGASIPAIVEVGAVTVASLQASDGSEEDDDRIVTLRRVVPTDGDASLFASASAFEADVKEDAVGKVLIAIKRADQSQTLDAGVLSVTRNGVVVPLVQAQYGDNNELLNAENANFFAGQGVAYFAPPGAGVYTVSSSVGLENAEVLQMVPFATLGSAIAVSASGASYSVENADADRRYKAQLFLGAQQGSGDYLLAETELAGATAYSGAFDSFSLTGVAAPTGTYYPSVVLLEYVSAVGENGETVETWSPVDQTAFDSTLAYVNNVTPAAPANVTLAYSGNETMTASWDAVANADSYLLTVYDAQGADTGLLFQVAKKDGEAAPAASIVMDLSSLDAGQSYSVGVKALIADAQEQVASCEGRSAAAVLNEAAPPILSWSENVTAAENGSLSMAAGVSEENRQFKICSESKKPLLFAVTNASTGESLAASDGPVESLTVVVPAKPENEAEAISALRIAAIDPATLDYALETVTVNYDSVAPSLSLDNLGVFPLMKTETGEIANITGLSEAGSTVLVWGEKLVPVYNSSGKIADTETVSLLAASTRTQEDGRFAISLSFDKLLTTHISVQAQDAAGNLSDPVKVSFPQDSGKTVAVAFDPNGEGAVCSASRVDVVSGTPIGTLPVAYWQDDEKLFDGWYTADGRPVTAGSIVTLDEANEAILLEDEEPEEPAEKVITLFAHWADSVVVTFDPCLNASCDTAARAVKRGSGLDGLPVPKHTDYTQLFLGWFTAPEDGTLVTEETTFSTDTKLFARWSPSVVVRFDSGVGACATSELRIAANTPIAEYPTPTARGYVFNGWYAGDAPVNDATVYAADTTLTARWTRRTASLDVRQLGCADNELLSDPSFNEPADMRGSPTISYVGVDGTEYRSSLKPTKAGRYVVTVQCDTFETAYVGSASFRIYPASCSVKGVFGDGGLLSAVVDVPQGMTATLIAAVYDAGGRLVDTRSISVTSEQVSYDTGLVWQSGRVYKLMVVDTQSYAPLCREWSVKA